MKKILIIGVVTALGCALLLGQAWAVDGSPNDELPMMDVLLARPMAVGAGIVGTAIFIVTLPFTAPTGSAGRASKMFITDPFRFSFSREFPDHRLDFEY